MRTQFPPPPSFPHHGYPKVAGSNKQQREGTKYIIVPYFKDEVEGQQDSLLQWLNANIAHWVRDKKVICSLANGGRELHVDVNDGVDQVVRDPVDADANDRTMTHWACVQGPILGAFPDGTITNSKASKKAKGRRWY